VVRSERTMVHLFEGRSFLFPMSIGIRFNETLQYWIGWLQILVG
jgi:hypothetical protein